MDSSGDILDGFFIQPRSPFTQAGAGGNNAWMSAHAPLQQQQHSLQPHTPSRNTPETTTATSGSCSSSGGKSASGHVVGNNPEYSITNTTTTTTNSNSNTTVTAATAAAAASFASHTANNAALANYTAGGGMMGIHTLGSSTTTASHAYTAAPSMYAAALTHTAPHNQMYSNTIPMLSHTTSAAAINVSETDGMNGVDGAASPTFIRSNNATLDRLLACLGECKGMATFQLQQLMEQLTASTTPTVAVLHQLVTHLEEDIGRLLQLRDTSATNVVNGMRVYHSMPAELSQDALISSKHQQQPHSMLKHQKPQQQQQQLHNSLLQTDTSSGSQLFGSPVVNTNAAAPSFGERGMWSFPEARGNPPKNGTVDLLEGGDNSAGGVLRQSRAYQYQPSQHLGTTIPPTVQMVPYMNTVTAGTPLYHPSSTSLLATTTTAGSSGTGGGDDGSSAVYATGNDAKSSFMDTTLTTTANNGNTTTTTTTANNNNNNNNNNNAVMVSNGSLDDEECNLSCGAVEWQQGHEEQFHSQTPSEIPDGQKFLAFVEFKRHRVRKYECSIDISPGQYVMVDGDRGRDCGLLVQTIKTRPDGSTALYCMDGTNVNAEKIKLERGRVLGVATTEEIDYLHHTMQRAERVALETCKKVCDDMGIKINLQDCEYQFDMEKVSFYFNSEHSVDFRPLVRELYRMFRVRIWMENTNPHVKNAMPNADGGGSNSGGNTYSNNNNNSKSNVTNTNSSRDEPLGSASDGGAYDYSHHGNSASGQNGGGWKRRGGRGAQKHPQSKDGKR